MLRLQVGKTYLDRNGNPWKVRERLDDLGAAYPFLADCAKLAGSIPQSFTADGRWSRHCPYAYDLQVEAE